VIAKINIGSRLLPARGALAMLAVCMALPTIAHGQDIVRQAGKLAPHRPAERELGPGQTDIFTVYVAAGQFLHVAVEKEGVNAVVTLADPQGKVLVTADGPSDAFGREPASLIAESGGEYQVRVAKSPRSAETGRYRMELTALRAPRERDRTRLRAESEMFAAVLGDRSQEREGRQQAVAGYERAAALWHSLRDDREEGLCLTRIGALYHNLGDQQKALDYGQRALALRRAARGLAANGRAARIF
jgi:tetratricopeptide (TPR) repeat protein